MLNISGNNFEHFPRSMVQLGALQYLDLSYCKRLKELPGFMGMQNLEILDLSHFNLIDGGLVKDIGCLSSLKVLDLSGNNFEHLPQRIAQLGALQNLDLSDCKRLTQLQEFPQQLDTIRADWKCLRVARIISQVGSTIKEWIQGYRSVNMPENWYVSDNFLGFASVFKNLRYIFSWYLLPACDASNANGGADMNIMKRPPVALIRNKGHKKCQSLQKHKPGF
ncbi:hypothetical protein KY289_000714 [Solanum tuberosum]|nr:hypothetical protein KY289_000714 [Solanum tuberosum]